MASLATVARCWHPRGCADVDGAQAHPVWQAERLAVLALLGWAAVRLRRSPVPDGLRVAWALGALLALSLGGWTYDVQFLRAINEAIGLSLLVLVVDRTLISRLLLAGAALLSVYVGWQYTTVVSSPLRRPAVPGRSPCSICATVAVCGTRWGCGRCVRTPASWSVARRRASG